MEDSSVHTGAEISRPNQCEPLSTNVPLSKDQLIEYLHEADIPGDAECTLQFDEGKFYLYFYWSEGPGAFGHTAVSFDVESRELVEDVCNFIESETQMDDIVKKTEESISRLFNEKAGHGKQLRVILRALYNCAKCQGHIEGYREGIEDGKNGKDKRVSAHLN